MNIIYIVGGILILAFVLDRLALWAESHGWLYWRRHGGAKAGGAGGLFDAAQTLIAPSNRHIVEEKLRKEMSRQEVSSAGNTLGLDPESGIVRVRKAEQDNR
ncbi:hypothetical protein [Nocardia amamiensis]|uniref:hypothetical protein n=1 Tax=Nocardia TaxID=1817 RepID=UPI0033E31C2A